MTVSERNKMEHKILIAGFGGQGVLFAGKVLAQAAMLDGLSVSWLPSYGPEMRGGTANCRVVVSDTEISSPAITRADVLIALNKPSIDKFSVVTDKIIITDKNFEQYVQTELELIGLNTEQCCKGDKFNGLSNMLAIGALIAKTGIVSYESVCRAIEMTAKVNAQVDIEAMEAGMKSV